MWIEMPYGRRGAAGRGRHATYVACGLKCSGPFSASETGQSCHVCGMWIEISEYASRNLNITSCHVCGMWIEMMIVNGLDGKIPSCHVCGMWIEISSILSDCAIKISHATYVACGLKSLRQVCQECPYRHATYVACGLKYRFIKQALTSTPVMPRMWHVD